MPMDAHDIESMIKAAIPDAEVTIRDLAGDGDHYAATVISESFRGKSRVQQHQIVYQSLQGPDGRRAARAGAADRGARRAERPLTDAGARRWPRIMHAARCFARSCRTSTAASPMPSCSSISSSFSRSRRSRTRCSAHFTPLGAVQVTLLFLAVWWVWVYTSWVTNWLDPEQTPVRMLLFAADARRARAVDLDSRRRSTGAACGSPSPTPRCRSARPSSCGCRRRRRNRWRAMNAIRIRSGCRSRRCSGSPAALPTGELRLVLWAVALGIEYVSPAVRFWIPRYGASSVADWVVEGGHMAERCARLHHHRARRIHRRHRRDLCRTDLDGGKRCRLRVGASSAASRCGGSISTRAPRPAPSRFRNRASRDGWRGSPIPICTCRSSPASSSPRWPTNSC